MVGQICPRYAGSSDTDVMRRKAATTIMERKGLRLTSAINLLKSSIMASRLGEDGLVVGNGLEVG